MSELINEKDRFQVKINVEHFKIENVTVLAKKYNWCNIKSCRSVFR
jgi:hypothetical protein